MLHLYKFQGETGWQEGLNTSILAPSLLQSAASLGCFAMERGL